MTKTSNVLHRFQVLLSERQIAKLRKQSVRMGVSVAVLIREAIDVALETK